MLKKSCSLFLFICFMGLTIKAKDNLSLKEAVHRALKINPIYKNADLDIKKANLLCKRASAARILPKAELKLISGVVPEARGDILSSQDNQTDLDGLGPFIKSELSLIQPLYTFGRLKNGKKAAEWNNKLYSDKKSIVKENIIYNVINYYLLSSISNDLEKTALKLNKDFKKLLNEVEKQVNDDESEIDETKLLEIKSNKYLIKESLIKARGLKQGAIDVLKALLNIKDNEELNVNTVKLPQFDIKLPLEKFQQRAFAQNHELKLINSGLKALSYKCKLYESEKKPLIFLGGGISYAWAGNRTDQKNPFVYDPFNYFKVAVFVGSKWDLNHTSKNISIKENDLALKKLLNKEKLLKGKILLEVKNNYRNAQNSFILKEEINNSLKETKKWLRLSLDNYDMGIGNSESLIKAYKSYFTLKAKYFQEYIKYGNSLLKLAKLTGKTDIFFDWLNKGKVYFKP